MSSGNAAALYEAQDQNKCAQEDAFQIWFEEREKDLEEEFTILAIKYHGLLDDDCPDYVSDNYDEFMEWAKDQFEKESA